MVFVLYQISLIVSRRPSRSVMLILSCSLRVAVIQLHGCRRLEEKLLPLIMLLVQLVEANFIVTIIDFNGFLSTPVFKTISFPSNLSIAYVIFFIIIIMMWLIVNILYPFDLLGSIREVFLSIGFPHPS